MGVFDIVLMIMILGGAAWILYYSAWKKKGHCQGCSDGGCDSRKK
jgi:hypothetical protein